MPATYASPNASTGATTNRSQPLTNLHPPPSPPDNLDEPGIYKLAAGFVKTPSAFVEPAPGLSIREEALTQRAAVNQRVLDGRLDGVGELST